MSKAKVTYVSGMQFVGQGESGHAIVMDSGSDVGGHNTGLRPSELLLIGIGGCSGMDIISILKKKRQQVTSFEINITGSKADEHPKKYTSINVEYVVKGRDIAEEAVQKAVQLSMDKYCSVKATLEGSAIVTFSYKILREEPAA